MPLRRLVLVLVVTTAAALDAPLAAAGEPPAASTATTGDGNVATDSSDLRDPLAIAQQARLDSRFSEAFEALTSASPNVGTALALEAVLLARSGAGQLGESRTGSLYLLAEESLDADQETTANPSQRLLLRLAIANHFAQSGQVARAARTAEAAFDECLSADATRPQEASAKQLIQLGMRLGWIQLNAQQATSAERLYSGVIRLHQMDRDAARLTERELSLAMLGRGWAAAMQHDRSELAAELLDQFVQRFPQHGDAAAAQALRIQCLVKADDLDAAAESMVLFLKRWPDRPQTEAIVGEALTSESLRKHASVEEAIEQWMLVSGTPQRWSVETVTAAIALVGNQMAAARFDFLLQRLGEGDAAGRHTASLLAELVAAEKPGLAEQVATFFLAQQYEQTQPMAMESACRWAGRTGRWAMLALAAETASPPKSSSLRTPHVDRLFAESLTRTQRRTAALQWWCHVVDHHQASDFGTLIRCAEAAVADGSIAEARQRLDQVQLALDSAAGTPQAGADAVNGAPPDADASGTGDQPDSNVGVAIRPVLLDVLKADLAVRQIDFEQARALYESVVRSPAATAMLLGRAQWMIGETYFLQRKFSEAIEAYRKVEGLDPQGPYVAAALIQAGKSFEQLGRTRQAGVCYGTLLSRFADSPHAGEARRRMAALPGGGSPGTDTSPRQNSPSLRR